MTDETLQERRDRQIREARQESADRLDHELRNIENKIDPLPSFARGVQVGGLTVGALNTMMPGMFGVAEWPHSVRMIVGLVFLLLAAHFLLRQRGFMMAQRVNRSVSP